MAKVAHKLTLLLAGALALFACSGEAGSGFVDAGDDAGVSVDAGSDAGELDAGEPDAGAPDAGAADSGTPADAGEADAGAQDAGTADAGSFDPTQPGPSATASYDVTITAPATGDSLPLHILYPTGDATPAPWVPVIIAHGFVLPASQYYVTAQTLAAFGAIAVTVDYPTSLFGAPNHVKSAQDLSAGLDWVMAQNSVATSPLFNKVGSQAVMLGHSLGGKLAILEAATDPRVAAVVGFDPVDGSMDCNATDCPNASSVLPLPIPILFLGETLDSAGSLACAPSADNFQALYKLASSPSTEVNITGADHMDFLDDPSTCGLTCDVCQPATASHDVVIGLARAEANAFIERYLRGDLAATTWIYGTAAQDAWIATGEAAIVDK